MVAVIMVVHRAEFVNDFSPFRLYGRCFFSDLGSCRKDMSVDEHVSPYKFYTLVFVFWKMRLGSFLEKKVDNSQDCSHDDVLLVCALNNSDSI
jgi:hypothetical protein